MKFILAHLSPDTESPIVYLSNVTFDYEGLDYDQQNDPIHLQKPKDYVMEPFLEMAWKFDSDNPDDCMLVVKILMSAYLDWNTPRFDLCALKDDEENVVTMPL